MGKSKSLSFQIGQLAESRSFLEGYRSAWFRCRIMKVAQKKSQIKYYVEYYDYPDEGREWLSLFETPPKDIRGSKEGKRERMMRPQFPVVYRETELPDRNTISEVAVVVDGVWSVGDMVDWFKDDCYWSGKIIKVMGNDTYKVKLPDEPVGEGKCYVAKYKDLRPSLNWSPDFGWTFPAPVDIQNEHPHARLIQPVKQATLLESLVDVVIEDQLNVKATPRSLLDFNGSISSHTSASSLPLLNRSIQHKDSSKQTKYISEIEREQTHGESMELDTGGSAMVKPSCSDSVSSTYIEGASAEVPVATSAQNQDCENSSAKKMRVNETIALNSTACGSIESAIVDLEELVCRVKWLKQMLKFGIPSTSSGQTWEFLEHPAVATPK